MYFLALAVLLTSPSPVIDSKVDEFCTELNGVKQRMSIASRNIAKARKFPKLKLRVNVMKEMAELIQARRDHDLILSTSDLPKDYLKSKAAQECFKKFPQLKASL